MKPDLGESAVRSTTPDVYSGRDLSWLLFDERVIEVAEGNAEARGEQAPHAGLAAPARADEEQDVVVPGDHVFGAQVHKRPELPPRALLQNSWSPSGTPWARATAGNTRAAMKTIGRRYLMGSP